MIGRVLRFLFLGIAAVVMQTAVVPGMSIAGQRPDLLVVFAVVAGAFSGASVGSIAGFLAGLLADLSHPPTLGAGAMAGAVAGYLGGKLQIWLDLDRALNQAVALAAAAFAHRLVFAVVAVLEADVRFWFTLIGQGIGGAVYTALVGTALFQAAMLVSRRRPGLVRR